MGVTWKDGRLAAKQLFDALRAAGIDPAAARFSNLFEDDDRRRVVLALRRAVSRGWTIVAMGKKVQAALLFENIAHLRLIHPAARGRIRGKQRYADHVRSVLERP